MKRSNFNWLTFSGALFIGGVTCLGVCGAGFRPPAVTAAVAAVAGHETAPRRLPIREQRDARGQSANQLLADGIAAIERGEDDTARALLGRAIAVDPANATAHTYLGALAERAGDLKVAEQHFATAARLAPRLATARNNYGAVLLRQGRTAAAAAEFEASLKLDPAQPSALVNLAQIRFGQGTSESLREALALFERAHRAAPDVETASALVVVSLRLNDREAAARHFRAYQSAVVNAPVSSPATTPVARAELGAALLDARLIAESVRELEAVVAAAPDKVEWVVLLARAYLARQDVPAAGRTLEGALQRGVEDARIYAALADVYEVGSYYENAIPAMRLALQRAPANETYHFRYGLLLTDSKAPAAAVIRLQQSLAQFPRSARLYLGLGIAQLTHGKNEEATRAFTRAIELDPQLVPALAYLGAAHAERGEYAAAVAFYERAIVAAQDKQAVPYYLAADAMMKQPAFDTQRAEKFLSRAVALDPALASARLALAKLYVRAERWLDAAAQLEAATQLAPTLAEAHYQLGRVYVRLKRQAEAQIALATFKRLSDGQKERKEGERRELVRRLADVRF